MAMQNGKNSIRLRISNENTGEQIFKAIITHPMENGRRKDYRTGSIIPADYIEELTISVDGIKVFFIMLGENISPNPFISFLFHPALIENQRLQIRWVDNLRQETIHQCVVSFAVGSTFEYRHLHEGPEIQRLLPDPAPVCKSRIPGASQ